MTELTPKPFEVNVFGIMQSMVHEHIQAFPNSLRKPVVDARSELRNKIHDQLPEDSAFAQKLFKEKRQHFTNYMHALESYEAYIVAHLRVPYAPWIKKPSEIQTEFQARLSKEILPWEAYSSEFPRYLIDSLVEAQEEIMRLTDPDFQASNKQEILKRQSQLHRAKDNESQFLDAISVFYEVVAPTL